MPESALLSPGVTSIESIVSRAGALYTLPAVAIEVLQLTSRPNVDVRTLKETIERDPALTVKILRVVNSSLFGVTRPIGDLNEALALLGAKQLKLLVLGFSLPEDLFLEVAGPQLQWYWNTTLVRSVAAREISEQLFRTPGDDAFIAGLLEGLGVLVLLRELGAPYAALVADAASYGADPKPLERQALGFDHVQLSAGLLSHWNMPPLLVHAIGERREYKRLAKNRDAHGRLAQTLHLAELVAQLVGAHRLSVLPDLIDAGRAYCDLDKQRLHDLVAALEPKVRDLAAVLTVDASRAADYSRVLADAHERLARLVESTLNPAAAGADDHEWSSEESPAIDRALQTTERLREAIAQFMSRPAKSAETLPLATAARAAAVGAPLSRTTAAPPEFRLAAGQRDEFTMQLTLAVGQCRALRQPLSLAVIGVGGAAELDAEAQATVERLLDAAVRCEEAPTPPAPRGPGQRVFTLPCRDRLEGVRVARSVVERVRYLLEPLLKAGQLPPLQAGGGVASVTAPAKNFQAERLIETAQRCLQAALAAGGVKSLEVN